MPDRVRAGCSRQRIFTADFIVNSTNTVLVTTNYRLGALGTFFNDETRGAPSTHAHAHTHTHTHAHAN
jgi:carboxylesterase type B